MMHWIPVEELKHASAYLDLATESFHQAVTKLEHVQGHQLNHENLLLKLQSTFAQLETQLHALEQQIHSIIPSDQNGQQGH